MYSFHEWLWWQWVVLVMLRMTGSFTPMCEVWSCSAVSELSFSLTSDGGHLPFPLYTLYKNDWKLIWGHKSIVLLQQNSVHICFGQVHCNNFIFPHSMLFFLTPICSFLLVVSSHPSGIADYWSRGDGLDRQVSLHYHSPWLFFSVSPSLVVAGTLCWTLRSQVGKTEVTSGVMKTQENCLLCTTSIHYNCEIHYCALPARHSDRGSLLVKLLEIA